MKNLIKKNKFFSAMFLLIIVGYILKYTGALVHIKIACVTAATYILEPIVGEGFLLQDSTGYLILLVPILILVSTFLMIYNITKRKRGTREL